MAIASSCTIPYATCMIIWGECNLIAAHKAESEQEDWPREGVQVRSGQLEGKYSLVSLRQQIVQLWAMVQGPQRTATRTLGIWGV